MKKLLLITLMLAFGLTGFSQTTKSFIASDPDWNNDDHWTPSGVPTAIDDVLIPAWVDAAQPIIYPGTNALANSITFTNVNWSLTVQGNLTVIGDITIKENNDFIVSAGGTVSYSGDVHVNNGANLHVNGTMEYVQPTSLVVTNYEDSGKGTLRWAVDLIADGGDITFKLLAGVDDILTVSTITVNKSLTIDGANTAGSGNSVKVWGAGGHRIFHITTAAAGKTIEFKNMRIAEGQGAAPGGGGILCEAGTLNVDNVYFNQNASTVYPGATDGGGAIHAINTTCTISNSTFHSNTSDNKGGGMYVSSGSTCNITNSTFNANLSDGLGGGMFSNGTPLTINGCTFNNNYAAGNGGGAIYSVGSYLSTINSTFYKNTAIAGSGGAIFASSPIYMKFTTVSANTALAEGGGVYVVSENLIIQNCMLGNNTANGANNDYDDDQGVVNDLGYNIVEFFSGHDFSSETTNITGQQANLFGTGVSTQTLAYNGGPTHTLKIEAGSVAIGAGVADATVTTDQRGIDRVDPPTIGACNDVIQTVTNTETGETWMDINLGALQVATSSTDVAAYGDTYQWGRFTEGHEDRGSSLHDGQATTPAPNDNNPWDGKFIYPEENWLNAYNNDLWQGGANDNNPCPTGFRLPTKGEWDAELATWDTNNADGAYGSPLKLTVGGYRNHNSSGSFTGIGTLGFYWAKTINGIQAYTLRIANNNTTTHVTADHRAFGFSVRCIKE